jgi:GNAT superfamily N-acetyltransferase
MKIDKNKIVFRRSSIDDIEIFIEYRIMFLKEAYGKPSDEVETRLRKSLKRYFAKTYKSDSFIAWIAEYENKPIGFSGMIIREQPGNFEVPGGKTGYILNMFTLKEFRKNGICSSLLQKLIDEAKHKKLDRVELRATKDGEPVYRRFGFTDPHDKPLDYKLID